MPHLHPDKPGFKGELFRQGMMGQKGAIPSRMKAPRNRVIRTAQMRTGGGRMANLGKPPTARPMKGVGQ